MPFGASKALVDTENYFFADSAERDGRAERREGDYSRLLEKMKDWTIRKSDFCVSGNIGLSGRSEARELPDGARSDHAASDLGVVWRRPAMNCFGVAPVNFLKTL